MSCGGLLFCVGNLCFVSPVLTKSGLLATVVLKARRSGCSTLHLVTYGELDYANEHGGTLTWSASLPITPEENGYVDGLGVARVRGGAIHAGCASRYAREPRRRRPYRRF